MKVPICALALLLAGTLDAAPEAALVTPGEARAAVEKYIPLLEKTLQQFTCAGACHHALGLIAYGMARERGIAVHEGVFSDVIAAITKKHLDLLEPRLHGVGEPEPGMVGYFALTARASGHPDPAAPYLSRWIASRQRSDGGWRMLTHRPPMQDSDLTATALSIHLLATEMPAESAAEARTRINRAKAWLASQSATTTEEEAFQILGLAWAGAQSGDLKTVVDRLVAEQRSDGGWGQFNGRASDAYATGLVLYALRTGAGLPVEHLAYQRALHFLLKTQLPDGSWLVPTRRHPPTPGLPYVETGFPHGASQFISCAGSNWAAVALLSLLPKTRSFQTVGATTPAFPKWVQTAMFGTAEALRYALDAGLEPNAATLRGTSLLMMSAHDSEKVALLLKRGAQVNVKAADGTTVLHIAAGMTGDTTAFRLLLDAGADVNATTANGGTVLGMAVTGEPERVALLLSKGADANLAFVHAGAAGAGKVYPLQLAIGGGAREIAQLLMSHGASLGGHTSFGFGAIPPLSQAVKNGQLSMVELLISLGADVNQRDDLGMTPLLWASISDFGRTSIAEILLAAGANPAALDSHNSTALQLAEQFQFRAMARLLAQRAHAVGR